MGRSRSKRAGGTPAQAGKAFAEARQRGAVIPQLPLWQQYQRIGGNLTPAQVSTILYQADAGDPSRLVELANECRQKDGHLHSVLESREKGLSGLRLVVTPFQEPGKRNPKRRDAKVAAFVQDALDGVTGDGDQLRDLNELVQDLQGALYHGYSVAEIRWRKLGGKVVPYGFRHINQRRFAFRDTDGRLVWSDTYAAAGVDLRATYPGQYIQHAPRINGDVPAREGLSRLLIWAALFRNWGIVDWLKLAELSWKPWRIGKLLKDAGKDDRSNLIDILERLTTDGVGLINDKQELDLKWPGGGQSGGGGSGRGNHQALCEFMASEMSKAVNGGTLTTDAGDRGARALGDVHERKELSRREHDAMSVAATLRRDVMGPMVRWNFGGVPMPLLGFETEETADLEKFGKAVGALGKAGMRIPAKWAHDQAGIPEPHEDEKVLGESDAPEEGEAPKTKQGEEPDTDAPSEEQESSDDADEE